MEKVIVVSFVLLLCCSAQYTVPDVTIEALKSGGFRAYIPDNKDLRFFAFHAKLNEPLPIQDPGDFTEEVREKTGDFWIAAFPNAHVKAGDRLYFWIFCQVKQLGYQRYDLNVTISDLLDEYPSLNSRCIKAATIRNGAETCIGDIILDEQFSSKTVDGNKWLVEQWIPLYTEPNFYFNSYVNRDDTRYVANGVLHLKPIALLHDTDIRGILDLRNGCTSKVESECYLKSKSWNYLPPVQSAKILSKISFKYGKIDIRAKLPAGEWLIPIIRLEQKGKENEASSPVIWVTYSRGNDHLSVNGDDIGAGVIFGGLVLNQTNPNVSKYLVSKPSTIPFSQDFHTYSLEWTPGKMKFNIDNVEYGSIDLKKTLSDDVDIRTTWSASETPYNNEYVLSLGVAVGGLQDFPDGSNSGNRPKPWSNTSPKFLKEFFDQRSVWLSTWNGDNSNLQVDYVKVTAI